MKNHFRLNRKSIKFYPLSDRENRVNILEKAVQPGDSPGDVFPALEAETERLAGKIRQARETGRPVICAFGAHTIKNGLAPLLIKLITDGWVTHLATNGAGIIHDWEFAFQGKSSEDVRKNVSRGRFGIWEETGLFINLAIAVGAYSGLGYGESVGKMVSENGLKIPSPPGLREEAVRVMNDNPDKAASALDLARIIEDLKIPPGVLAVEHPYKSYGLQAQAYETGVPFTAHPMFGHDIIYTHPANSGAAIGRTAERDFLGFAGSVSKLEGGVYLSVGSAVMSPMIFEKSLSMARNIASREDRKIENFSIAVVDLAESTWNWQENGEPPETHPDYYLRFYKTFYRMGGHLNYIRGDNRQFFLLLLSRLS
ncbi:MAG: hypothetical protein ACLFST_06130 [Spirochaetia bacterium]